MIFNIDFELIAILFLLIVMIRFFSQRQFPLPSNRLFGCVLVIATADLALDVLATLTMYPDWGLPVWVPYLMNGVYYMLQLLFPAFISFYILGLADNNVRGPSWRFFALATPCAAGELLLMVTIPMDLVFRISPTYEYSYGPLSKITYVFAAFYIVLSMILMMIYRKRLTRDEKNSLLLMILLVVLAILIQFQYSEYLLTGVGIASGLTIMFFVIQDPSRMVDNTTHRFNYDAFLVSVRGRLASRRRIRLIAVRINGLRRINTLYGVQAGSDLLRSVGEFLADRRHAMVFRVSDVRFAVIADTDTAYQKLIRDISDRLTYTWDIGTATIDVELAACHLYNAERLDSVENILNVIEHALSRANSESLGASMTSVNQDTLAQVRREIEIENALRDAIPTGEGFLLNFQPIIALESGRFESLEVLLRYSHPLLGNVSPDEFTAIAERCGLAVPLDAMVVSTVFEHIRSGDFAGFGLDHIQINLSGASFADTRAADNILKQAKEYGIDASFVIFEITESVASSGDTAAECIRRLREAGFRLALDDFGTGYANITQVLDLPFSLVKLDRSLLYSSRSVFKDLTNVFRNMGLPVVAEGVETAEQSEFIRSVGINAIQGYLYARPMPMELLRQFLKK